jgi:hypothetical protein
MQTILAILITGCMGLAAIFLPIQMSRSARSLGFSRRRQVRVGVVTFLILGTWLGLVLWGALTGFFGTPVFEIYGIPFTHVTYLVLGPVIFGSLLLWLSPTTRALIDTFTPFRVIMIETARAIGAVFLVRYFRGELPGIFALPAGIGDVFIGVTAPIMAYLYRAYGKKVRALAIGWNILGIAELATSFTIGYLAFALKVFPGVVISNVAVPTAFPLVLIPGFGVPLTILVHIIALRLIFKQKS